MPSKWSLLFHLTPGLFVFLATLFGFVVGSFLNVIIYRLPKMLFASWKKEAVSFLSEEAPTLLAAGVGPKTIEAPDGLNPTKTDRFNLAFPASHCPHCHHPIRYYDNIPVLSFLLLRGKCRDCQAPIHWRYPLVEAISGLLTGFVAYHFGFSPQAFAAILLTWVLLVQTFIDLEHQILLDDLTLPTLWIGLLLSLHPVFAMPEDCILGAVLGYSVFWLFAAIGQWVLKKEAMGNGDFKLLALLGAWLGWKALPTIILLASIGGSLIGLFLIWFRGHPKHKPIPFGPFLTVAGWIALIWNDKMVSWWLNLLS